LKGTDGQNEKDLPSVAIAHMSALVAVCVRYGASMRVPACQAPCSLHCTGTGDLLLCSQPPG